MLCAYTRPRYQVSVYRTIGPLVFSYWLRFLLFSVVTHNGNSSVQTYPPPSLHLRCCKQRVCVRYSMVNDENCRKNIIFLYEIMYYRYLLEQISFYPWMIIIRLHVIEITKHRLCLPIPRALIFRLQHAWAGLITSVFLRFIINRILNLTQCLKRVSR